jgi:hypothetical protein
MSKNVTMKPIVLFNEFILINKEKEEKEKV